MSESRVFVKANGQSYTCDIRTGLAFQALIAQHPHVPLEFDCRKADCGICLIKVLDGAEHLSAHSVAEKDFLTAMHAHSSERLACQCRILGPVSVEIPQP